MPVTTYATVAQFFQWGLPQTALGARSVADVQAALDAASALMDDYFRSRYVLPFAAVGLTVARHCVAIAVNIFMGGRGFSPVSGADESIVNGLTAAEAWLDKVQRRLLHPDVTDGNGDASPLVQAQVVSCGSVINDAGCRAASRGW